MQVATILPTPYLSLAANDPYHMCLAHLIGRDPIYTEFFKNQARMPGRYVIMDNGVMEGDQKGIEEIVRKANLIGAQEIILPDVFKKCDETLEQSYEALEYVRGNFPLKVMAVPQGQTIDEWLECALNMIGWDIDCLGIPKVLVTLADNMARRDVLRMLGHKLRGLQIHLLGCWITPLEILAVARAERDKDILPVRGVDSAIAYVYSREHMRIDESDRPSHMPIDFNDDRTDGKLLIENIDLWRKCCTVPDFDITKI